VARTQIIECPKCGSKVRLSVRDDGEATVLGSERKRYSPLEELRKV